MSFNNYPHVYSPIKVGNMELKNRIQFSPIVSNHADYFTGAVNEEMLEFASMQAGTGAGLVTIGSTPIDFEEGRDFFACLSVVSDHDRGGLSRMAREVHRKGAKLSVELTHAGMWAADLLPEDKKAWVPSIVDDMKVDPTRCMEIGRKEMDQVIETYKQVVNRCIESGFDMVMIHLAHGNLASAFMSPHWNKRTDEYGGSFENRVRFPLEILKAAHEAAAGRAPIEIRFVGNEWIEDGMPLEERIEFLKLAEPYIDMVCVSAGTMREPWGTAYNMPGYYIPSGCNVEYAAAFKEACPNLVVSVVGGIGTLDQAEEVIASGKADIVAMAKALMADNDFVNKGLRGEEKDIRPCLRCFYCLRMLEGFGHLEGCAVNPGFGWEYRTKPMTPICGNKKAMVIGGGVGGLEATRVLTRRSFDTVLYEKSDKLGGRLHEASSLWNKDGFRRYLDWTVRTAQESGARIVMNTEVTPDTIREENPDVVIVACGGELIKPPIPGIDADNIFDVSSVDRREVEVGKRVVVCGAGLSGAECGVGLAREGHDVTLVDMQPVENFYKDLTFFSKPCLDKHMEDFGVVKRGSVGVKEFTAEGVVVESVDGVRETIPADSVVLAFGVRPNKKAIQELCDVVPRTYVVGDADKIGVIGSSVNQAHWICRELDF